MENKIILAIESSCDDTACAISKGRQILSSIIANQQIHNQYGGVVPELASRAHQKNIVPVVSEAIRQAAIEKKDIDYVAFTKTPGLLGSLLVGESFAKSFARSLGVPCIEINHMKGHIFSNFIDSQTEKFIDIDYPFLCLTVSGGHTQISKVNSYDDIEVLGRTIDDAAGEAFDKIGKALGLDYPAGPIIDKLAQSGNPDKFKFTEPNVANFDFSFSGLKTNVIRFLEKQTEKSPNFIKDNLNDIAASVQKIIIKILIEKLKRVVKFTKITTFASSGGVSANSLLRKELEQMANTENYKYFLPKVKFTTDNAAMIAACAYYKMKQ